MKSFFLRKLTGVTFIFGAVGIFIYLGWVYVVMPGFVKDNKLELQEVFASQTEGFGSILGDYAEKREVVIGGVIYPVEQTQPTEGLQTLPEVDVPSSVTLSIPTLDITDAVVELDVNGKDETIYNSVLTRAVAHFAGTAYPGGEGNTFLFGHSKIPVLAGTDYESIFTYLHSLKNGALVSVKTEKAEYTYRIDYTAILSPKDVFILNQPKTERLLTLMTCIPPGFNSQRFVAVGSLQEVKEI